MLQELLNSAKEGLIERMAWLEQSHYNVMIETAEILLLYQINWNQSNIYQSVSSLFLETMQYKEVSHKEKNIWEIVHIANHTFMVFEIKDKY